MSRKYDSGGKAHQVLKRLLDGPAMMDTFWRDAGILNRPGSRRKLFHVVLAMRDDRLVTHAGAGYSITTLGLETLARLQAGENVEFEADRMHPLPDRKDAA